MGEGDFKTSTAWFERARDVSAEHGFAASEGNMCSALGKAFKDAGRTGDALEQLQRGLGVVDRVLPYASRAQQTRPYSDRRQDPAFVQQIILRDLVDVHAMVGQFDEAEAVLVRVREGAGGAAGQLWSLYLRGSILAHRRDFADAAAALQAAVDFAGEHPELLQDPSCREVLILAQNRLPTVLPKGDAPPLSAILHTVQEAWLSGDYPEILRWESRLEEMLSSQMEAAHPPLLHTFATAHDMLGAFTNAARLYQRRSTLLGKMERFRDQGTEMCQVGRCLINTGDTEGGAAWFESARKLGAQHGFFQAECGACLGLGRVEAIKGRQEEAEELFRHALTVLDFVEDEGERDYLEGDITLDLAEVQSL
ncbi:hypothetical protein T484DRAFT_1782880 [Baffinella frigidus]|nr:hypothetical protein T484DRAFT_1782880 [Cryptophyta sp. CCMP2293]